MGNPEREQPVDDREEGYIEVPGGKVWYEIVGASRPGIPLLTLHGGPGFPSTDLYTLRGLADLRTPDGVVSDRPVIFYDQLGCGKSRLPDQDTTDYSRLWHRERFVEELVKVREGLGLDQMHLLGLSWGGTLAAEYLITKQPKGVQSVILASPMLSAKRVMEDHIKTFELLGPGVQEEMLRYEADKDTGNPRYQELYHGFEDRFLLGQPVKAFPSELQVPLNASVETYGKEVLIAMHGKSWANMDGNLKNFERVKDMGLIKIPVLYTCGRNDEITPKSVKDFQKATPKSELVIFENSAHMAHFTEMDLYLWTVADFMQRVEARSNF